jgi:uncharacterized protein YdhG (YjbR/CyaY superfamily)
MKADQTVPTDIDEYIAGFPPDVQKRLKKLRTTIKKAAPQAQEAIKYRMPTFRLHGNLIHFAAYKNHIGLYPAPTAIAKFKKELSPYASAKGSARFPLDRPIPFDLVGRIVRFRVQEDLRRAAARKKRKR